MTRITEDIINAWMSSGYLTYGCYEDLICEARKEEKEEINNEEM